MKFKQWNFPIEDGLCPANQTELCLPGDWQQLCWCWATNQTKLQGLWSLDNSWITRAPSQKRPCLFLQTWAIKWLCLWNQLPRSLLYWDEPFPWQQRIPSMGRKQLPYHSPRYSLDDYNHDVKSVGTDSTMLRKTNWTRTGDVLLTCNSGKQGDHCKLRWVESFPEMLSNGQRICYDLR